MRRYFTATGSARQEVVPGRLLGEGASGRVHSLANAGGLAAKLYHDAAEARRYEAKIGLMLANPPDLPELVQDGIRYPQIAWPKAKLFDEEGRFAGFLMPEVDFARSTSLVNLLQRNSRRAEGISDFYGYRVLVARNLAAVFAELHRAGHHMIDMKPANLRFYPRVSWMAVVDADGFSIAGPEGRMPAEQVSDEYIAPESWQQQPERLGEAQDRFALAVIIFQLLNNGVHPFSGSSAGGAQPAHIQGRVLAGLYPYGLAARADVTASLSSIHRTFRRATRELFDRAFLERERPSADEWRLHLDSLLQRLVPCSARPEEHAHFGLGCGFCTQEARIAASRAAAAQRRTAQAERVARAKARAAQRLLRAPAGTPATPSRGRLPQPAQWRARPAGPRRRSGAALGALLKGSAILAAGALAIVGAQRALDQVQRGSTAGAEAGPAEGLGGEIFDSPRRFLVQPADGALSTALRSGPGTGFRTISELYLNDDVIGRRRATADGGSWIEVTRPVDGATGYVPEDALVLARLPEADRWRGVSCAAGSTWEEQEVCSDAILATKDRQLRMGFRALLAGASPPERDHLVGLYRGWKEERRNCRRDRQPVICLTRAFDMQLGFVQAWQATRAPAIPAAAGADMELSGVSALAPGPTAAGL